jgi:transcriptional regulator of acetoin/glycerol metabolism
VSQPRAPRTTTEEYEPSSGESAAAGRPTLLCGFPIQVALPIPAPGAIVGRAWLAEAGVRDTKISGEHLRFSRAEGRLLVEDVGSRNGTWIGGERVAPRERKVLVDGAVVRVGRTLFVHRASFVGDLAPAPPLGMLVGPWGLGGVRARLAELTRRPERNVLIEGATGTGKEHLAAAVIHALGRGKKPVASINVAAVTASLFEAQLFGWVKGAYSGSVEAGLGVFGANDGGSVFLDEIGELPLDLQPKLLRALENREIQRVGSGATIKVDVLVVAATNRPLGEAVERGAFRRDLHARFLARLALPSLADRPEDVYAILVALALRRGFTLDSAQVEVDAVERLMLDPWTANARDLDRVAAAVAATGQLTLPVIERELAPRSRERILTREAAERMVAECGGVEREAERRFNISHGKLRRALGKA